jgi:hypothetical protein
MARLAWAVAFAEREFQSDGALERDPDDRGTRAARTGLTRLSPTFRVAHSRGEASREAG